MPEHEPPPGCCVAYYPPEFIIALPSMSLLALISSYPHSHPEEQAVGAVPLADDGIPAEHQGGSSLLGPRHLAEGGKGQVEIRSISGCQRKTLSSRLLRFKSFCG